MLNTLSNLVSLGYRYVYDIFSLTLCYESGYGLFTLNLTMITNSYRFTYHRLMSS